MRAVHARRRVTIPLRDSVKSMSVLFRKMLDIRKEPSITRCRAVSRLLWSSTAWPFCIRILHPDPSRGVFFRPGSETSIIATDSVDNDIDADEQERTYEQQPD